MKEVSQRIFLQTLGDSKISLHQLSGVDTYLMVLQDLNSADIAIMGHNGEDYEIIKNGNGELTDPILTENINKNQLEDLGELLTRFFPKEKKK